MSFYFSRFLTISAVVAAIAAVLIATRAAAVQGDVTGDFVLGQPNFTSNGCGLSATLSCGPQGVAVDGAGNVYVAESQSNRVLEFDNPLNTDAVADRVFGQGNSFTSGVCNLGGISASSLCYPTDVAVDAAGNLYVVDWQNNRALEYFTPLTTDKIADRVFGQGNNLTTGTYTNTPTANTLTNPSSVAVDSAGRVYIADAGMYRVLEYDPPNANTTANRVFGQLGSFTTKAYNNGGGISADGLSKPHGIALDTAGNLYVTDTDNARALMYKSPITTDTTADVVFGQLGNFTTGNPNINGITADSLESPTDIAADGAGNVYITDTGTERTVEYDNPLGLGTTADLVFGQGGNFSGFGYNSGGIGASSAGDPWAVSFDTNCNVWIADYGNNRTVEYDKPPHACVDFPAPSATPPPAPTPPVLNTAPGTGVVVSLNGGTSHERGVELTFDTVSVAGNTSVVTSNAGPPPPPGQVVVGVAAHGGPDALLPVPPVYYEIATTATVSGVHSVCLAYDGSQVSHPSSLELMHYTVGSWANITSSVDTSHHVICGHTVSFSPFALMQPANAVGGLVELPSTTPTPIGSVPRLWELLLFVCASLVVATGALRYGRRNRKI